MVRSISQSAGNSVYNIFRFVRDGENGLHEVSAAGTTPVHAAQAGNTQSAAMHRAPASLMSGNFAAAERDESRHAQAREAGRQAVNLHVNRQMAIVNAGLAELGSPGEKDTGNDAIRSLIGKKSARRMMEEEQRNARETAERNLEEIKEDITEKTEEAAVPEEGNGNPIEKLLAEDTEEDEEHYRRTLRRLFFLGAKFQLPHPDF